MVNECFRLGLVARPKVAAKPLMAPACGSTNGEAALAASQAFRLA